MSAPDVLTLPAPACLPEWAVPKWADEGSYDLLLAAGQVQAVGETVASAATIRILKPNGSVLFAYRHNCLPRPACLLAFDALKDVRWESNNRPRIGIGSQTVRTGIVGFYDRRSRGLPFCRACRFTIRCRERYERVVPLIRAVNRVYADAAPAQYALQRAVAEKVPDYHIGDTAFSTATVNRNYRFPRHPDKGNLKGGLSALTVLGTADYTGAVLVFPRFRVGVDVRVGDVLLADLSELHANTPMVGGPHALRISLVCYTRDGIQRCLKPRDELRRAQRMFGAP